MGSYDPDTLAETLKGKPDPLNRYGPNFNSSSAYDASRGRNGYNRDALARQYGLLGGSDTGLDTGLGGGLDMNSFLKTQQDRQDALLAQQKTDTANRFASGQADTANFMGRFNAAVPGLYDATEAKFNVPFWRTTANAIGNRIDELKGNTNNAGAGGYANASQVDQGINTNYLPRYAQATNTANTATSLAQGEYAAKIAPFDTEAKLLTDRLSRESTGYNLEQQRELDSLISQINAGTTLGTAAMTRATELARLEQEKLLKEQELQYRPIGYGGSLYNTATGTNVGNPPVKFTNTQNKGSTPAAGSGSGSGPSVSDLQSWIGSQNTSGSFHPVQNLPTGPGYGL